MNQHAAPILEALAKVERRLMLRGALSLGGLAMLGGCDAGDLSTDAGIDRALWTMLRFNDRVQAWLFSRDRLAATFPPSAITRPARFNAFYPEYQVQTVDPATWRLEIGGLVQNKAPLALAEVGADTRARYVGFKCFDDYWTSIDMASALQPQTVLTLDFDGAPLDPPFGAPLRLRVPTKLGFKSPKYLSALYVTNTNPGGYWEKQGYNWFSGS